MITSIISRQIFVFSVLLSFCLPVQVLADKPPPASKSQTYPIQILFAPKGGIKAKLANLIQNAQSSIDIAAYNLFLPDVTLSLVGAKARGVAIRIILDDYGPTVEKSDFPLLQRNGIPLIMMGGLSANGAMNNSFALFDVKQLALGSYRWSEVGENEDYSSMVFTSDPEAIKAYADRFDRLWSGS